MVYIKSTLNNSENKLQIKMTFCISWYFVLRSLSFFCKLLFMSKTRNSAPVKLGMRFL